MHKHAQRPRFAHTPGQAMVELAIAMGVLLLLILGAIDAIQIMMTQYTVNQAARAAAHQAALIGGMDSSRDRNAAWLRMLDGVDGTVAQTARAILDSGMTTSSTKASIAVTCSPSPCRRYSAITVRLYYYDDLWAPAGPFTAVEADYRATRVAEQDQQTPGGGGGPGPIPGGPTATPNPAPTSTPRPPISTPKPTPRPTPRPCTIC